MSLCVDFVCVSASFSSNTSLAHNPRKRKPRHNMPGDQVRKVLLEMVLLVLLEMVLLAVGVAGVCGPHPPSLKPMATSMVAASRALAEPVAPTAASAPAAAATSSTRLHASSCTLALE